MIWRTVGFMAVTLQRQNVQVLVGCAPTLESQVHGRLGWPLSETPEFWGAAPEGALAWAAAEFELPSARRGGREEDRDGETPALSQGGAGHLRAAGRPRL